MHFLDQLLHAYKYHGRDMSEILCFIFASCEPLIRPAWSNSLIFIYHNLSKTIIKPKSKSSYFHQIEWDNFLRCKFVPFSYNLNTLKQGRDSNGQSFVIFKESYQSTRANLNVPRSGQITKLEMMITILRIQLRAFCIRWWCTSI